MFSNLLAVIALVFLFSAAGNPNPPKIAQGPNMQEKTVAVDLARAVNTAEMAYKTQSGGAFAAWGDLATSEGFVKAISRYYRASPKLKDLNPGASPDVIAGWRLQLMLSHEKDSYVVVIASTSDRCSYAVVSEQDGVIREAAAIGCSE